MRQILKLNEFGRRIGESHPRAVLSDHDVERLLMPLLEERARLIAEQIALGRPRAAIDAMLAERGLSYQRLADKFEVTKMHIWRIDNGWCRCQTPV